MDGAFDNKGFDKRDIENGDNKNTVAKESQVQLRYDFKLRFNLISSKQNMFKNDIPRTQLHNMYTIKVLIVLIILTFEMLMQNKIN